MDALRVFLFLLPFLSLSPPLSLSLPFRFRSISPLVCFYLHGLLLLVLGILRLLLLPSPFCSLPAFLSSPSLFLFASSQWEEQKELHKTLCGLVLSVSTSNAWNHAIHKNRARNVIQSHFSKCYLILSKKNRLKSSQYYFVNEFQSFANPHVKCLCTAFDTNINCSALCLKPTLHSQNRRTNVFFSHEI